VEEARDSRNQRGERLDPVVRWERAITTDEIRGIPHHVQDRGSEVRAAAVDSEAAWRAWAAQQQAAGARA
jgi:hypothetical protein